MEEKAYSIREILSNDKYIIPIYQRNYSWEKREIAQLIKDIVEFFDMDNYDETKSYYLGSLVCFKKGNGDFELIDGQQRHTTLILINLVLKTLGKQSIETLNLKFDSRKNTQIFLESVYQDFKNFETSDIDGVGNIKSAVDIIREELLKKNVDLFAQYFYDNVKLFRVTVPLDTDLNHYFEIMNSRGEQLEKHEIVKALLIGQIQGTTEVQNKFAAVWDACSDMNGYIYSHFKSLSDSRIDKITFDDIPFNDNNNDDEDKSLNDILANHSIPSDFSEEKTRIKEKYRSIIDFPNFLLQVLKIRHNDVPLDDKSLVKHFTPYLNEPVEFIADLLKYRWLFDKYIIKQDLTDTDDSKQSWGIRKLNVNDNSDGTVKTFDDDDEELVKLQVMLYYSDSTNTYNNWLFEFLKFVNSNRENYTNYTSKIFEIAGNKFDSSTLSYPDISIFNLYFIDFLLWKLYITEVQNKEYINLQEPLLSLKQKIFNKRDLFHKFKFKHVSSKEHLFPQSKANDFGIEPEYLNSVGNLCLISSSQNSQGNKDMPVAKKKLFEKDNSSLKRLIMFESFENDRWEVEQIQKHQEEIISLLHKI